MVDVNLSGQSIRFNASHSVREKRVNHKWEPFDDWIAPTLSFDDLEFLDALVQ